MRYGHLDRKERLLQGIGVDRGLRIRGLIFPSPSQNTVVNILGPPDGGPFFMSGSYHQSSGQIC